MAQQSHDSHVRRRSVRPIIRLGRSTTIGLFQPPTLDNGRDSNVSSRSNKPDSNAANTRSPKKQAVTTFLQQKAHRVHQVVLWRQLALWIVTVMALLLAWAIGYCQWSVVFVAVIVAIIVLIWNDQSKKIAMETEQAVEVKLRRKKTLQLSETAEWVNLALNRWWITCSDSVVEFAKDYFEPLMQEMIPSGIESIHLESFDLGNQTPFVKSIQIFDPPASSLPQPQLAMLNAGGSPTQTTLIANVDVGLIAPESKVVLRARLGGKRLGYDTMVYLEGLHLSGSMQAVINIDFEAPFPHIASITATFVRSPEFWYSLKVLKGLRVTDFPFLKSWIHSMIMTIFQSLLVDPGRVEINFLSSTPQNMADHQSTRRARGVLTVTISGNPPEKKSEYDSDPRRWCTLKLGEQKHQLQIPPGREPWRATFSFLVYDLTTDTLMVKVKHRRIMYTMTLACHTVELSSLHFVDSKGDECSGNRSMFMHNTEANIGLDMEYTLLPPFSLNSPIDMPATQQVAGVLYIHIHSAQGLISADVDGLSDPYCVVLVNKRKVLMTHYILDTLDPKWERGVEIFVSDYTQATLTFVVYDWDGPLIGDDFLGAAKLSLQEGRVQVLQKQLPLDIDGAVTKSGRSLGNITVSVIFRPINSVAQADIQSITGSSVMEEPLVSLRSSKESGKKSKSKASKMFPINLIAENHGVLELSIIAGRNLVAMDRNGYSDPYIIVKYGQQEMYKTHFISKTLDPQWNCNATLSAPAPDVSIVLECWDKDKYTNDDFMGSMAFNTQDLTQFENGACWCSLNHVGTGEILLELKKTELLQDSLSSADISHLDEASKHLAENSRDVYSTTSSLHGNDSDSDDFEHTRSSQTESTGAVCVVSSVTSSLRTHSPSAAGSIPEMQFSSANSQPLGENPPKDLRVQSLMNRRHTVCGEGEPPSLSPSASFPVSFHHSSHSINSTESGPASFLGPTQLLQPSSNSRRKEPSRLSPTYRGSTPDGGAKNVSHGLYYMLTGKVMEATGLKGNLEQLEIYIKVRLNSRPAYQRRQKFDRGIVIHRTKKIKGSADLRWEEGFSVKETSVPSDSLLTIDLKSGHKVTLGTHVITLDKFFDGHLKGTRWLDLGNEMRVRLELSRIDNPYLCTGSTSSKRPSVTSLR